jgi:hypothetical protein
LEFDVKKNTSFADTGIDDRCGTYAGYLAHGWRKEMRCEPCFVAQQKYKRLHDAVYKENVAKAKREWFNKNRQKMKEYQEKWRAENPHKVKKSLMESRARNKETYLAYQRKWQKAHPEKARKSNRKRRAVRNRVDAEPYTTEEVLALYGTNCHLCGLPIDLEAPRHVGYKGWENGLHLDHDTPIFLGGADMISNVKPAHGRCNLAKRRK